MALSREKFELLVAISETSGTLCKNVTPPTNYASQQSKTTLLDEFRSNDWIDSDGITEKGLEQLEPYRVKRAVIMAAGFGSRLVPITLNTPKPLVRVNGKRIIDTLLDAITAAGIEEIVIVRGYLSEQFDQLLYKYPNIRFVENPMYDQSNNISSVMCVRYLLQNAYIMEADLVIRNPSIIKKYQYTSNYLGFPVETSDDWCFVVKDGDILVQTPNGNEYAGQLRDNERLYQEIGISYWDKEAGCKLANHMKEVFDREDGKSKYWDYVPLWEYKNDYKLEINVCNQSDVTEIDSFKELIEIDSQYKIKG